MKKSISEHSNRFKLEVMLPLESIESPPSGRGAGRSSFSAIPPPNPAIIFAPKCETVDKQQEKAPSESENLCNMLCNSYKFVVNYGVFEPNFEWLPCEVRATPATLPWKC